MGLPTSVWNGDYGWRHEGQQPSLVEAEPMAEQTEVLEELQKGRYWTSEGPVRFARRPEQSWRRKRDALCEERWQLSENV